MGRLELSVESLGFAEASESGWQAPGSHTSWGPLQSRGLSEEGSAWPHVEAFFNLS